LAETVLFELALIFCTDRLRDNRASSTRFSRFCRQCRNRSSPWRSERGTGHYRAVEFPILLVLLGSTVGQPSSIRRMPGPRHRRRPGIHATGSVKFWKSGKASPATHAMTMNSTPPMSVASRIARGIERRASFASSERVETASNPRKASASTAEPTRCSRGSCRRRRTGRGCPASARSSRHSRAPPQRTRR